MSIEKSAFSYLMPRMLALSLAHDEKRGDAVCVKWTYNDFHSLCRYLQYGRPATFLLYKHLNSVYFDTPSAQH